MDDWKKIEHPVDDTPTDTPSAELPEQPEAEPRVKTLDELLVEFAAEPVFPEPAVAPQPEPEETVIAAEPVPAEQPAVSAEPAEKAPAKRPVGRPRKTKKAEPVSAEETTPLKDADTDKESVRPQADGSVTTAVQKKSATKKDPPAAKPAAKKARSHPRGTSLASARYGKAGLRRGAHRRVALLGLVMIVLSLVGVAALTVGAVFLVQNIRDDSAVREELTYFLEPMTIQTPITAFDSVEQGNEDQLLLAAVWRIINAERIRMLQVAPTDENYGRYNYETDDTGRLKVPVAEVEASYAALFGTEAEVPHHSMNEEGGLSMEYTYSADEQCYYVPTDALQTSLYEPVLGSLKVKGSTYTVRIAYVPANEIRVDDHGNTIPPTDSQGAYDETYTVKKTADGWQIVSMTVADRA